MKRLLLAILSLALFFSCAGESGGADGLHSIDSRIVFGSYKPAKLSEIAESVEYIRLETREDVLIGMYPQIKIVDSLAVVYSGESGLFVFDSRTGRFKYKIPGFRDRGPLGYSGSNGPLTLDDGGRIILHKWDRLGVWDYTTGRMLDYTIPLNPYIYSPMFFVNDSLLAGNVMNISPETKSGLDVIFFRDGGTVREYGFMEKTDMNPNITSYTRVTMSEYADYINYTHYVHDYIYGIDKTTLEIEPRYKLNLGGRLKLNVTPMTGDAPEAFTALSAMCETDKYLFLQFTEPANETIHLVCYDKSERTTLLVDRYNYRTESALPQGFVDDLGAGMPFFPHFVASDGRLYRVEQAVDIVNRLGRERAAETGISEDDNPVIVVAKLKGL